MAVICGTPTPEIDPRGANRARPDAHLDRVGPGLDQRAGALGRSPRCRRSRRFRTAALTPRTSSTTFGEWPWARSTTSTSTPASTQRRGPLESCTPNGGPDAQPAPLVLAAWGVLHRLSMSLIVIRPSVRRSSVHQQQFLDLILRQNPLAPPQASCSGRSRGCPWSSPRIGRSLLSSRNAGRGA